MVTEMYAVISSLPRIHG